MAVVSKTKYLAFRVICKHKNNSRADQESRIIEAYSIIKNVFTPPEVDLFALLRWCGKI